MGLRLRVVSLVALNAAYCPQKPTHERAVMQCSHQGEPFLEITACLCIFSLAHSNLSKMIQGSRQSLLILQRRCRLSNVCQQVPGLRKRTTHTEEGSKGITCHDQCF